MERELMRHELELLSVLNFRSGSETPEVSRRWSNSYCEDNKRQRSAAVRSHLMELRHQGYVRLLDNQKPDRWAVTAAGLAALAKANGETP